MTEYQDSHFYEELKESDLYILTEFFKALGNPICIRILLLLMEQDSCVGDLAEQLGITQSAVSHQLNLLKSNKLVRRRRDGKMIRLDEAQKITVEKVHTKAEKTMPHKGQWQWNIRELVNLEGRTATMFIMQRMRFQKVQRLLLRW